jgi:hypothetical protein
MIFVESVQPVLGIILVDGVEDAVAALIFLIEAAPDPGRSEGEESSNAVRNHCRDRSQSTGIGRG